MNAPLMTTLQQAELQGKVWKLVEEFRVRHELSELNVFRFLICFAWGYARRRGESHHDIMTDATRLCDNCEQAYQRARPPLPA